MRPVPEIRIRAANGAPIRAEGEFVLYWMIATRRPHWNFALDRAVELAADLRRPVLVLEALGCGHRWASDRMHRFVLDGMHDNGEAFARRETAYYPYVEPSPGAGRGLLEALGKRACTIITDEFPCFIVPDLVASAARRLPVRLEAVDSNGLLPLAAPDRAYERAVDFRRFIQRELPGHLQDGPRRDPLATRLPRLKEVPAEIRSRWPMATSRLLDGRTPLSSLPIDHAVSPAPSRGGWREARRILDLFLDQRLPAYGEKRNRPDEESTSSLSPYLHFGHVSTHDILNRIAACESWSPARLGESAGGKREGWWGMSPSAEGFLDQAVTWRELGYNYCFRRPDYASFASLPRWAMETLARHGPDPRPQIYDLEAFENAATHDELWNAAQNQLRGEGRIHNYLRMLWGKKILHWSATPEAALDIMIELNNKYALDGRNPNSYNGIFWTLGRFDRPWAPEREIFGTVRYMSSDNTRRKLKVDRYVERWRRPSLPS
jgi:deoxyribodipyrimidine photo-lyase